MAAHGLPIKIQDIATGEKRVVYFPSLRRAEGLRELGLKVQEIQMELMELADIENPGSADYKKMLKARERHLDAVRAFFEAGFKAAGYSAKEVEENVAAMRPEMFDDIYTMAYAGMGGVDFTLPGR